MISPQELEIRRAGNGAGIVASGIFLYEQVEIANPRFLSEAAAFYGVSSSTITAACLAFVGLGVLLFLAGTRRARGQRDAIVAAKALAWMVAVAALYHWRFLFDDGPEAKLTADALYIGFFARGATRLALALRGMPEQRLPNPEDVPDMPTSGPASRAQAEEAMSGDTDWQPPQFAE